MKADSHVDSHVGGIVLHLACLMHDHKWAWHLAGIRREMPIWRETKEERARSYRESRG